VSYIVICGGRRLSGELTIMGSKNATLPLLAACLLTDEPCVLSNIPLVDDIFTMAELLRRLGADVTIEVATRTARVCAAGLRRWDPDPELVRKERGSFLVMGPLLARLQRASSPHPGGCAIGARPVDVTVHGFRAMGAQVQTAGGWYDAWAPHGLHGASIYLDYPSVTGTENLMLAASLAPGRTVIKHASCEPEVVALAEFLTAMGARIRGAGSSFIEIEGVSRLHGAEGRVIPDRIEAGTFAAAAVATEGQLLLRDVNCDHLEPVLYKLQQIGACTECRGDELFVSGRRPFQPVEVQAIHFPGFPTDLQAVFAALLTQAEGVSIIQERVYENRLLYVDELRKMGAQIVVRGQRADIYGPTPLYGAAVRALDLRAGASLIVGGLVADGETVIADVHHIQRGYEDIVGRLASLGADIRLVERPATAVAPAGG